MPISDLTGTTWVINSSLSIPADTFIGTNLEFTSNNTNYVGIGIGANPHTEGSRANYIFYDFAEPHSVYANGWSNQADRTLAITGGTDTTNATLIAWLQANAVQVPVADLTGTNWILNSNIYITEAVSYSINSIFSDYTFSSIDFNFYTADGKTWKSLKLDNSFAIVEATATANPVENTYSSSILSITGGTDATNPDLITWLSQNATLQVEPIADNKIFLGNLPIKKILIGNIGVSKIIVDNIEVYTKDAVNI